MIFILEFQQTIWMLLIVYLAVVGLLQLKAEVESVGRRRRSRRRAVVQGGSRVSGGPPPFPPQTPLFGGIQWGYSKDTVRIQWGYSEDTVGIQ